jgi:predicted nuclease with TOPRIM domain
MWFYLKQRLVKISYYLGQCATARKLQEMEKTTEELREQLETLKMTENDLELALTHCHGCIEELVKTKLEAVEKVSESLQLVECAVAEKHTAVLQEARIRGKNTSVSTAHGQRRTWNIAVLDCYICCHPKLIVTCNIKGCNTH